MLVSIIMSAYNAESTVSESIESIINQSFRDFEFIIINDGSTDNTLGIVNHYRDIDQRISVISHQNMGTGLSKNKGISLSKGTLIAFIDSDDIWISRKLEIQLTVYKQYSDPVIIISDMILYDQLDSYNHLIDTQSDYEIEVIVDVFDRLVKEDIFFQPATALIPKYLFTNVAYFTDDISGEDYYPYLMFSLCNIKFIKIHAPLYGERSLVGSLQRSTKSQYLHGLARHKAIDAILKSPDNYIDYLDKKRIDLLKKASDRFLCVAVFGARRFMTIYQTLSFLRSKFISFNSKKLFLKELLKTVLFPLRKMLQNRVFNRQGVGE